MIVADTNLLAYLLIEGDQTPAARAVLLKDATWAVPPLWRSELRNVLALYLRQHILDLADSLVVMQKAEEQVMGREFPVPSADVLSLAAASKCTAYDCEFVALANQLNVPLVTTDSGVLRGFPNRAVSPAKFLAAPTIPSVIK